MAIRLCTDCRVAQTRDERTLQSPVHQYLASSNDIGPKPEELVARWRHEHGDAQSWLLP